MMNDHQPMPVSGYNSQPQDNIDIVNSNKALEEEVLRALDALAKQDAIDKRWLAIGQTHIEQGFMAINRSVFKPTRVQLPERRLYTDEPLTAVAR